MMIDAASWARPSEAEVPDEEPSAVAAPAAAAPDAAATDVALPGATLNDLPPAAFGPQPAAGEWGAVPAANSLAALPTAPVLDALDSVPVTTASPASPPAASQPPAPVGYQGEPPVDRQWLAVRETALVAVRQDYEAARAAAIASNGSGPGWTAAGVASDESGRIFSPTGAPLVFVADAGAAPVQVGYDESGPVYQQPAGRWLAFDDEAFAAAYRAQAGAPLQALAKVYDTDVAGLLAQPDLWRIATSDHALNAGPAPAGVAMGDAGQLGVLDLYVADPQIARLIDAYGGTAAPATGGIAQEQVRLYGQTRYEQLSRLGDAMKSVRDQYSAAMAQAQASGGPGWTERPRMVTTSDESGQVTTQPMFVSDESGQRTAVIDRVFDPDAFTAWYTQQPGLQNQAFATFYGQSHTQFGSDESGRTMATTTTFDNPNWQMAGAGAGLSNVALVSIDPNAPPDLFDSNAVGFDLEAGWATSIGNLRPDTSGDWLETVVQVAFVAAVAYVSAGTLGPAVAEGLGYAATGAAATTTGIAISAAVTGAATSVASGMLSGNLTLKGVLQGALSGALSAGLLNELAPVVGSATAGMGSTAANIGSIALRGTVQGAVQALLGGSFRDGAIAGFASGLAQVVSANLQEGIAQAVASGKMDASMAPAANMFARAVGSAIKAVANPDDPNHAFASDFLGEVLNQAGASAPPTAFDDEGNLMPGVVDPRASPAIQRMQLQMQLEQQGFDPAQARAMTDQYFAGTAPGTGPALPPTATGGSPQDAAARQAEAAIQTLAQRYGGIDNIPASELRAVLEPLTPTLGEVDSLPVAVDTVQVASLGNTLSDVWAESSKNVAIAGGVIAGLFQGVGDTTLGLGRLALNVAQASQYLAYGGDTGLGRLIPGGREAYQNIVAIGKAVGQIAQDPVHFLGATVAGSVDKVLGALDTANASGSRSDWFLYGAAVGRVTFDVAGVVLGAAGLASGLANVGTRLMTFVELRAAASAAPELVTLGRTAAGNSGLMALPELTAVEPAASGGINASKLNGAGYALTDLTAAERNIALRVVAEGDQSGALTESLVSSVAQRQGLRELPGGKYGSNNGFDHVFVGPDGTVTLLIDSKQMTNGTVSLSPGAGGQMQLSRDWIGAVLNNLDSTSPAFLAVSKAIESGTLVKGIAAVDRASGTLAIVRVR